MTNEQNPMPLKDLPQYLKSLQEKGETGSPLVVGMGAIQPEPTNWITPILSICAVLFAIGITSYFFAPHQLTLDVALDNDSNPEITIAKIIADADDHAKIIAVSKKEDGTHELKISTRKSKHALLESIKNNKDVKKVK